MGNLDVDGFDTATFENHATALLRQILSGRQRMAAITSKETQLMAHKQLLQKVDNELEPSLRTMIDEVQTYIHPSDLALFVIAAKRTDLLPEAQEILDSVMQERRLMSLNDLLGALASTSDMPGTWAASLFGEMDAERDATPQLEVKKASIDLAAMHRGMGL